MKPETLALSLFLIPGLAGTQAVANIPDCEIPGLGSAYLTSYFCGLFDGIANGEATRTLIPDEADLPQGPGYEWLEIELLRDAYRIDPKKTLELIQRIRTAGGLPEG